MSKTTAGKLHQRSNTSKWANKRHFLDGSNFHIKVAGLRDSQGVPIQAPLHTIVYHDNKRHFQSPPPLVSATASAVDRLPQPRSDTYLFIGILGIVAVFLFSGYGR